MNGGQSRFYWFVLELVPTGAGSYLWLLKTLKKTEGEKKMLQKWYRLMMAAFLAVGVLAGCGAQEDEEKSAETTEQQEQEITVEVELSQDNGAEEIASESITAEEGTNLMQVMEDNFKVEQSGGFINTIEGVGGDEKKAWMYTVNGEEGQVGAEDYELKDGDQVTFDYHAWE
ncbi:DUF4430 domain-containing protein [Bacillus sp. SB49]|nr:DUF4430 domain-containing protein [Bacillus sp. SB49]